MSEPFVGQIMMWGGTFAPQGWANCSGQLLPIAQNVTLFSLLGTTYGGDGQTNFALPDLRGRVPISYGQGPGLAPYQLGQKGGQESVALNVNQIPAHSHVPNCQSGPANEQSPAGAVWAKEAAGATAVYSSASPNAQMNGASLANTGGNQPHSNLQPYCTVNFVIALVGIYPSRS